MHLPIFLSLPSRRKTSAAANGGFRVYTQEQVQIFPPPSRHTKHVLQLSVQTDARERVRVFSIFSAKHSLQLWGFRSGSRQRNEVTSSPPPPRHQTTPAAARGGVSTSRRTVTSASILHHLATKTTPVAKLREGERSRVYAQDQAHLLSYLLSYNTPFSTLRLHNIPHVCHVLRCSSMASRARSVGRRSSDPAFVATTRKCRPVTAALRTTLNPVSAKRWCMRGAVLNQRSR